MFFTKNSRSLQQLYVLSFDFLAGIRRSMLEVSQFHEKLIYKLNVVKVKLTRPHESS